MALFAIGDLHLSFQTEKPMDIFSDVWKDYENRLKENWNKIVNDDDTVVIVGDISWAMSLDEAVKDFEYINNLNGKKIIIKGNHDYWWSTLSKINNFLKENGFDSIRILHNNSYKYKNYCLCGSRGWLNEPGVDNDKVKNRELMRLEASLKYDNSDDEKIVFMHYPVIFDKFIDENSIKLMKKYNVKQCYFGHIHGNSIKNAVQGEHFGINFKLVSADAIDFLPHCILK